MHIHPKYIASAAITAYSLSLITATLALPVSTEGVEQFIKIGLDLEDKINDKLNDYSDADYTTLKDTIQALKIIGSIHFNPIKQEYSDIIGNHMVDSFDKRHIMYYVSSAIKGIMDGSLTVDAYYDAQDILKRWKEKNPNESVPALPDIPEHIKALYDKQESVH